MKKTNIILIITFLLAFLVNVPTTFAQKPVQLESIKKSKQELKAQNKKGAKVIPQNKLTPAQKKAIEQKRMKQGQLTPKQKAQRDEAIKKAKKSPPVKPMSRGGKLQKLTPQKRAQGKPITKTQMSNRARNISKAKAIAKVNQGKGRAKAADENLIKAKAKLEAMKKSGKYTPEQIKKKERVLATYEEQLSRLKRSVSAGQARVNKQ